MYPTPEPVSSTIALEPVYNILMSITALRAPENYGGLDEWVTNTVGRLDTALLKEHKILFDWIWLDALTNAVDRGPATEEFSTYIDTLAKQDPVILRDRLFHWTVHATHTRLLYDFPLMPIPDSQILLDDAEQFALIFEGMARAKGKMPDPQPIHALFNQPAELQGRLVAHLKALWHNVVQEEWLNLLPRLQATVAAFQQLPLHGLTMLEAMEAVTVRNLRPVFRLEALLTYRHVRFIPQVHNGPYILWFGDSEELRIGFPAHEPPSPNTSGLRFDTTILVNRFKAVADENRLSILMALREAGELSTQDVIDRFGLDKSAASRHLRQLVATNLIEERREAGAKKVYQLNPCLLYTSPSPRDPE